MVTPACAAFPPNAGQYQREAELPQVTMENFRN
jgi:hypothetical protein